MSNFSIQQEHKGDVTVISISGRVDSDTAPSMNTELSNAAHKEKKVVLDLKDLEFLSSAGIRGILDALKAAKKSGCVFKLASVPEHISNVFQMVGMMQIMHPYSSLEEAIASF